MALCTNHCEYPAPHGWTQGILTFANFSCQRPHHYLHIYSQGWEAILKIRNAMGLYTKLCHNPHGRISESCQNPMSCPQGSWRFTLTVALELESAGRNTVCILLCRETPQRTALEPRKHHQRSISHNHDLIYSATVSRMSSNSTTTR